VQKAELFDESDVVKCRVFPEEFSGARFVKQVSNGDGRLLAAGRVSKEILRSSDGSRGK